MNFKLSYVVYKNHFHLKFISLNPQERDIMQRYFTTILVVLSILGFTSNLLAQETTNEEKGLNSNVPATTDAGYKYGQSTVGKLSGVQGARYPAISPDGSLVTFSLHGDIWVMPATGGRAKRLTMHRAYDVCSRFSPDGTTIAFSSNRNHGYDVYTIPVSGGTPKQITFHNFPDLMCTWAPDGQSIVYISSRSLQYQIWQMNLNGGTPKQLTKLGAYDGCLSPDSKFLAYAFGTGDSTRKKYKGTGNSDIFLLDLESGSDIPLQLTETDYNEFDPYFTADGKFVVYRAEIGGTNEIFLLATDGKSKPIQITKFINGTGVDELFYDPKTNTALFAREFYLFKIDFNKKPAKIEHMPVVVQSDSLGNDTIKRTYTDGAESPDISKNGKVIAFIFKGDIWFMSAQGGAAQQITDTPHIESWPRFSPDGSKLAYFSNQYGNDDIFILDIRSMQSTRLTNDPAGDFFHSWSPDGKYIVFCSERGRDKNIYLTTTTAPYKVAQLTDALGPDDDPSFTPDGKQIVFDSGRTGFQGIYIMDVNGDNQRALYNSPNFDQLPRVSPDGEFVVFESGNQETIEPSIIMMRLNGSIAVQVVPAGSGPFFTPDGSEIIYQRTQIVENSLGTRSLRKDLYRIKAPKEINIGKPIPMIAEITSSIKKENLAVFEQAWQTLKEGFYDVNMHGTDWNAIRTRYYNLIAEAETKEELYNLVNRMVGELGASHMGHYGYTEFSRPLSNNGYLGIDGELVQTARGYAFRISKVVTNGPADKVWLRAGDHIFSVGNQRLNSKSNFYAMLDDTTGKQIQILVTPGTEVDHARYVGITPIGYMELYQLNYMNWLKKRQMLVSTDGKNKIAYVHLTNMDQENLQKFYQTVIMANAYKQNALIIDCRNNGGGRIHEEILDVLLRKPYGFESNRMRKFLRPQIFWDKPVIVLCNERSYSDAELFPAAFQQVKRGLVVGVQTPGDVIGTREVILGDDSQLRVPGWGWYDLRGKKLEGVGAIPDIIVKLSLEDRLNDNDPQLKKAVEVLWNQLYPKKEVAQTQPNEEKKPEPKKEEKPQTQPSK